MTKKNIRITQSTFHKKESDLNIIFKSNSKDNFINKKSINASSLKTLKMDDSYSYNFFKNNNEELIEDNEEESNITSTDININKEIGPGEEIIINKGDNTILFNKKFNKFIPKDIPNKEFNNFEYKNSKIKKILNSSINESDLYNEENNDDNKINISKNYDNNINNIIINKSIFSSFNNQKNEIIKKPNKFKNSKLAINRDISLIIESSYENCNLITKQRLIKDKILQEKLKIFLENKLITFSSLKNIGRLKKYSLGEISHKKPSKIRFSISLNQNDKKEFPLMNSMKNLPNIKRVNKTILKKSSSKLNTKKNLILMRTSSFNENYTPKKIKFKDDFINDKTNKVNEKKRISGKEMPNLTYKIADSLNETSCKKILRKKNAKFLTSHLKIKKKNDMDLLSQIDLNIENTNQKLNNPDIFYSNYFNYLLEEKIIGKDNRIHNSDIFGAPKSDDNSNKKNIKQIKRVNTSKKIVH